jgi:hypothetical protein
MTREQAMARRTLELDLVPADAYWRDPTVSEARLDFAAMEEADGKALHGSRLRLGILLGAQRNAVILRTRSTRFSPALARFTPAFMGRQIAREFVRIHARGYSDGLAQAGATDGPGQRGTDRLVAEAKTAGYAFTERVLAPVRRSIVDAFALTGQRVKPQEQLEAEIRTAYAKWIEPAPDGIQPAELRFASPLGLLYKTWEQKNSPISAYLDVLFGAFKDEGLPQLTTSTLSRVVSTERNRLLNAGVYESALLDEEVEYLQYSNLRDGHKVCGFCGRLDGIVRPKNDYTFWGFYTPPVHDSCMCFTVAVKGQEQQPTDKKVVDDLLESVFGKMPPGFGGYDPKYEIGGVR